MTQLGLFHNQEMPHRKNGKSPNLDKFQASLLFSAIGDALGWPTEFLPPDGKYRPPFKLPLKDFVSWKKRVGGKWWGYEDYIEAGSYSDDTQLTLAVARSINHRGTFEVERFAYEELPLWLHYERGGGRSIKTAAKKLIGKRASWLNNFYKTKDVNYLNTGANGAAMRNLPIALINVDNEQKLLKESFFNTIVTHGHPRAIIGAMLFGLAINYAILEKNSLQAKNFLSYLQEHLQSAGNAVAGDDNILEWIKHWEGNAEKKQPFRDAFEETRKETLNYLGNIILYLQKDDIDYYNFVGALQSSTKGSGVGTVCAALYIFLKYLNVPQEGLVKTANILGSDTDTIGVFVGGLMGAYHGLSAIPDNLLDRIQDKDYLSNVAGRLHRIVMGANGDVAPESIRYSRRNAYLRILAWEIGLHEMFWDALEAEGVVFHPTMGRGVILDKDIQMMPNRSDYTAKLIKIAFDTGQSCVFHSRVKSNEEVSESLAKEIDKALN